MARTDTPIPTSSYSAKESDRSLAGSLIGGAFGFIGIAIFASASYAEKVVPNALWWGNFAETISVIMFVASIYFGGRGWTRSDGKGFLNSFNLQAVAGLLGLLFLAIGAGIFAFNPKADPAKSDWAEIDKRIDRLEFEQAAHRKLLTDLNNIRKPASARRTQ